MTSAGLILLRLSATGCSSKPIAPSASIALSPHNFAPGNHQGPAAPSGSSCLPHPTSEPRTTGRLSSLPGPEGRQGSEHENAYTLKCQRCLCKLATGRSRGDFQYRYCLQAVGPAKTARIRPGEREEVRSQIGYNSRHIEEQAVARGCRLRNA